MKRLKELRKEKGMTQADMARRLGIARTTYAGYELGSIEPPFGKVSAIASILSVSVDYLNGDTGWRTLGERFDGTLDFGSIAEDARLLDQTIVSDPCDIGPVLRRLAWHFGKHRDCIRFDGTELADDAKGVMLGMLQTMLQMGEIAAKGQERP